jgi:hypothetical protein
MWNDLREEAGSADGGWGRFSLACQKDPRKADADGSWPPASVGTFPDAHLLRRCGMVHCHSRRLTHRPSTLGTYPLKSSTRDDAVGIPEQ